MANLISCLHVFVDGFEGLLEGIDHCLAGSLWINGFDRFVDARATIQGNFDVVRKADHDFSLIWFRGYQCVKHFGPEWIGVYVGVLGIGFE